MKDIDRSDEADARRFRWLLSNHGYFMEEGMLCFCATTEEEKDEARSIIDEEMDEGGWEI